MVTQGAAMRLVWAALGLMLLWSAVFWALRA
jgi:hypothetical protein